MGADGGIVSEPGADVNWGRAGFEANPAPASIPRRIRSRVCPDGDHERGCFHFLSRYKCLMTLHLAISRSAV